MSSEKREFRMSPALLWKVIHDQAGTISKAILEGVMNSVDAGSTFCDVTITANSFAIKDDGKGFVDENEIFRFFESFGEEHVEGDAKYGRFRMGRGQIMAFGHNIWKTGEFEMDVNLKPQGQQKRDDKFRLGYELKKGLEKKKGCCIEVDLYEENWMSPSELSRMVEEVGRYVKYVDIPVRLNGEVVSVDPATEKWDIETDEFYLKRKANGGLTVYNLGSLVKTQNAWYTGGVSGVVVSKKQLKVNFARNDIQSDCPIYKKITKLLKDESAADVKRNKPMDENARIYHSKQLMAGESDLKTMLKQRLITDVTNSHHPLEILMKKTAISAAPRGDMLAETAHTRGLAFVMSNECLERFGVETIEEFVQDMQQLFADNGYPNSLHALKPIDAKTFGKVISSSHIPLKPSELNPAERLALSFLNEASKTMHYYGHWMDRQHNLSVFSDIREPRKVHVGRSETALAWTNGTSDIWFDRDFLMRNFKSGFRGMTVLANTMLHEYIHREADTASHEHGIEFYEAFHEYSLRTPIVTMTVERLMSKLSSEVKKGNKALKSESMKFEDKVEMASRAGIGSHQEFVESHEQDIDALPEAPETFMAALTAKGQVMEPPKKRTRPPVPGQGELDFGGPSAMRR